MIHVGNCLDIMPTLEANRFDSIVTDPPYGLGFMGKGWDHSVPGRGAAAEGMRFEGIELDPHYAAIAEARIRVMQPGLGF